MGRGPLLIALTCLSALLICGTAQATHDPQEAAPPVEWSAYGNSFQPRLGFSKQQVGTVSSSQRVFLDGHCNPDHDAGPPGGRIIPVPGRCTEATLDIAVSGPFAIADGTCPVVFKGAVPDRPDCTVDVVYVPSARGPQAGFLRLMSNPVQGLTLVGTGCRQRKTKDGSRKCKAVQRKAKKRKG